jgi:hypothetical protein
MELFEVKRMKWVTENGEMKLVEGETIGTFNKYYNAKLFRDAYNKEFKASAFIVEYKRV